MSGSSAALVSTALASCASGSSDYDTVVAEMTQPLAARPDAAELVRFATLAANSHNTQPWRFSAQDSRITIAPDPARRTPVVDPDDHHLFASLGCAAENLSIAARARGMSGDVVISSSAAGSVSVGVGPGALEETALFAAIPIRQCTRSTYDGKAAPADVITRLEKAARIEGVDVRFIVDRKAVEDVLALLISGNSRQIEDPAFVDELKTWLRFSTSEAVSTRDGLYSAASGNPKLPRWLGSRMFDWVFSAASENDKLAEQVRSSAGLVVFVADTNDTYGWASAGRAYQRFALQASVDGLKHAFVNQAVEVPDVRSELQALLGLGNRRPNLIVRFGYGEAMPRSLRRKVGDVMA